MREEMEKNGRPEGQTQTGPDKTDTQEDKAALPNGQDATGGEAEVDDADMGIVECNPISDDFDMAALASEGTGKLVRQQALGLSVGVGKPSKTSRFRAHADPRYWPVAYSVELEVPGEFEKVSLIVAPSFVHLFQGDAKRRRFALYCTAEGSLRFWPYAVDEVGEPDGEHALSVFNVCLHAQDQWVSAKWQRGEGYRAYAAVVGGEPQWPDKPPLELLKIAHKGRLVANENHPRLREYLERKPL